MNFQFNITIILNICIAMNSKPSYGSEIFLPELSAFRMVSLIKETEQNVLKYFKMKEYLEMVLTTCKQAAMELNTCTYIDLPSTENLDCKTLFTDSSILLNCEAKDGIFNTIKLAIKNELTKRGFYVKDNRNGLQLYISWEDETIVNKDEKDD